MNKFWEELAYIALMLCVIANITVGYIYLFSQTLYFIANSINVIRDYKLDRPKADKIRDIIFLAITVGLIIIRLIVRR